MLKELMHDQIFLAGKSEIATKDDLQVAQDLLNALKSPSCCFILMRSFGNTVSRWSISKSLLCFLLALSAFAFLHRSI